jgi:zinc protease
MSRSRLCCLLLFGVVGCASSPPPPASAAPSSSSSPSSPAAAPTPTPAPAGPPAAPVALRPPEAILADAVAATGGAAAWNAHKTLHFKMETTLQGMGMGGTGERFQTRGDKALTIMEMTGLGRVREGNNGKVAWTEDPVQGIRYLDGIEAEQTRIASSWNVDMHASELFVKLESATEPGPDGAALECVVATPKLGSPLRSCYDAKTHLQVSQSGVRASPQGDMPFRATIRAWREVGGVKIPFESNTQLGPITTADRVTSVAFDEPMDDKMFDPPKPTGAPPSKKKKSQ